MKKASERSRRPGLIYALLDPRTSEPRYVGCCFDMKGRRAAHMSGARSVAKKGIVKETLPKDVWLVELLQAGLEPEMRLLETIPDCFFLPLDEERRWLLRLRARGFALTNTARRKGIGRNIWLVEGGPVWLSCDGSVHASPVGA